MIKTTTLKEYETTSNPELTEYVRVRKDEYEGLKENIQVVKTLERHKKLLQQLNDYQANQIVRLEQQKQDLKEWLEEEIKNADDKSNSISNLTNISYGSRSFAFQEVLERLG